MRRSAGGAAACGHCRLALAGLALHALTHQRAMDGDNHGHVTSFTRSRVSKEHMRHSTHVPALLSGLVAALPLIYRYCDTHQSAMSPGVGLHNRITCLAPWAHTPAVLCGACGPLHISTHNPRATGAASEPPSRSPHSKDLPTLRDAPTGAVRHSLAVVRRTCAVGVAERGDA